MSAKATAKVRKRNRDKIICMRTHIARRDGEWVCHYCRVPLIPIAGDTAHSWRDEHGTWHHAPNIQYPTLDHKIPRSKGGTDDPDNLVLACSKCNSRKQHRYTYEEFLALTASERAMRVFQ